MINTKEKLHGVMWIDLDVPYKRVMMAHELGAVNMAKKLAEENRNVDFYVVEHIMIIRMNDEGVETITNVDGLSY